MLQADNKGNKMDKSRSTTPPLPPPESSEILQQQPAELSHSTPPSAQPEIQEGPAAPMEIDDQENQETQDIRIEPVPQSRLPRPAHSRTPEPNRVIHVSHQTNGHAQSNGLANGHSHAAAVSHAPHLAPERLAVPDSPIGNLSAFDWEDLEARFEKALADANDTEQGLMEEFERLIKYFNVWASAASAHDNERAAKRLQTRTHFVKLKETDLASKRQHYESVVQAFQNAMVLLGQMQN